MPALGRVREEEPLKLEIVSKNKSGVVNSCEGEAEASPHIRNQQGL